MDPFVAFLLGITAGIWISMLAFRISDRKNRSE